MKRAEISRHRVAKLLEINLAGKRENRAVGVIALDDAQATILDAVAPLTPRPFAHRDARGLVLAEDVVARERVPPFANTGMDGYAVAAHLRNSPATYSAQIVALTGFGQDADRQRALAAGFDDHMTKPVSPEALRELLARVRA